MSDATLMTDAATNTEGAAASTTAAADASTTAANTGATDNGANATANQQQTQGDQGTSTQQDADGKTGDEGNGDKKADGDAKQGAPETYADFNLPEGVEVDSKVLDDIKVQAKELNLSQEQAQKLADYAAQRSQEVKAMQAEALQKAKDSWGESSKADKEFGGEQLAENLSVAKKALDTFGTPELRALLNESGLGNHPEIIRAFYRAGKAISEDRFVPAGTGAPKGNRDAAKSLYPNQQT